MLSPLSFSLHHKSTAQRSCWESGRCSFEARFRMHFLVSKFNSSPLWGGKRPKLCHIWCLCLLIDYVQTSDGIPVKTRYVVVDSFNDLMILPPPPLHLLMQITGKGDEPPAAERHEQLWRATSYWDKTRRNGIRLDFKQYVTRQNYSRFVRADLAKQFRQVMCFSLRTIILQGWVSDGCPGLFWKYNSMKLSFVFVHNRIE